MKTTDNTIIKVVIPRWVEAKLHTKNIALILEEYVTNHTNDEELEKIRARIFINAPEHIVKKTDIKTRRNELIAKSCAENPCHICTEICDGFCNENP